MGTDLCAVLQGVQPRSGVLCDCCGMVVFVHSTSTYIVSTIGKFRYARTSGIAA